MQFWDIFQFIYKIVTVSLPPDLTLFAKLPLGFGKGFGSLGGIFGFAILIAV